MQNLSLILQQAKSTGITNLEQLKLAINSLDLSRVQVDLSENNWWQVEEITDYYFLYKMPCVKVKASSLGKAPSTLPYLTKQVKKTAHFDTFYSKLTVLP